MKNIIKKNLLCFIIIIFLILIIFCILFLYLNRNLYANLHENLYKNLHKIELFGNTQPKEYLCDTFYKNEKDCNDHNDICFWNNSICKTKCLEYNNIDKHQEKVDTCTNDSNCIWSPALAYNICQQKKPIESIIYKFNYDGIS
jgi:hypothetical protein